MLQFVHVGKRFGSRWAPVRYSLSIQPGELVWLTGPPGAGKSVLVNMALGFIAPTTGVVTVNGINPAKVSRTARLKLRRSVSAVRDDEPSCNLPVESWIALGLWCAGQSWARSVKAAREWMEKLGMRELAMQAFGELARGERFAFSLARALARNPQLLLVDWVGSFKEPLPEALLQEFARYVKEGGACLLIGEPEERMSHLGGRLERLEP